MPNHHIRAGGAVALALLLAPGAAHAATCPPTTTALPTPPGHGYDFANILDFGPPGLAGGSASNEEVQHAVLWRNGVAEDTGLEGFVADIDRRGDVLVSNRTTATVIRPGGARVALPGIGGAVSGRRLNDSGHVAGSVLDADGHEHPAVWLAPAYGPPHLLPIPRGHDNAALQGINNRGDAVGYAYPDPEDEPQVAFKWHRGRPAPLPDGVGGLANVIDDRGVAAGVGVEGGVLPGTGLPAVWIGNRQRVSPLAPVIFAGWFGTNGQGDWAGFTFAAGDPLPAQHAIIAKNTAAPRALVALSGNPHDRSTAHAVSVRHDGDVDVGGFSVGPDGQEHATIWHCAAAQAVDPAVVLG